jgi:small conductance mechanosensitive channel
MKTSVIKLLEKYHLGELIAWVDIIFITLEIGFIVLCTWLIFKASHQLISNIETQVSNRSQGDDVQRVQTLSRVLRYVTSVGILALSVMIILSTVGVSVAPLIATAGLAGVAIGFGAQTLVKDYFTGFVMLLEDQIRQGDIVEIAGKNGTVEEVTLRYIRLRDYEGIVHFVPNSTITVVTNRTRNFSYAVMDVLISSKQDIADANSALKKIAQTLRNDPILKKMILDDLEIAGVETLSESSVTLRCRLKVMPQYQAHIRREFQGMIKVVFEQENIKSPFVQ